MRDPDRITLVLGALERAWEKYPDERLGQLLVNAVGNGDVLYAVEDDLLLIDLPVELTKEEMEFIEGEPERRREAMAAFIKEAEGRFGFEGSE